MEELLKQFRTEAVVVGERRAGRKFPKQAIAIAAEYAAARRSVGASWQAIADELGVGVLTVQRWSESEESKPAGFTAVRVIDQRPRAAYAAVLGGLRIEGLELEAVIALAKALS